MKPSHIHNMKMLPRRRANPIIEPPRPIHQAAAFAQLLWQEQNLLLKFPHGGTIALKLKTTRHDLSVPKSLNLEPAAETDAAALAALHTSVAQHLTTVHGNGP
jgi:hypothetical protein